MESPTSNRGVNLKAHKSLPRRRVASSAETWNSIEKDSRKRRSSELHREGISTWIENASPTISPPSQHLPLTPPSLPEDTFNQVSEQPIVPEVLDDERLVDNGTPVGQMSPPTPDLTPPRLKIREKMSQRYPSSAAESFKTAREFATSEDSLHRFPSPESDLSTVIQAPVRSSNATRPGAIPLSTYARNIGLGLGLDLKRDTDSTIVPAILENNRESQEDVLEDSIIAQETAAVKQVEIGNLAQDGYNPLTERFDGFSGTRDGSLLLKQRIVSDRLQSHRKTLHDPSLDENESRKSTDLASLLPNDLDMVHHDSASAAIYQPFLTNVEQETFIRNDRNIPSPVEPLVTVVDQIENIPSKEIRTPTKRREAENSLEPDLRRLSRLSTASSNVVEAIVITPPRQKQHELRRSGKNYCLRDVSSSGNRSNRSSLKSTQQIHALRHKPATLLDKNNRASLNSDSGISMGGDASNIRDSSIPLSEVPQRRSSLKGHRKKVSITTKDKGKGSSRPVTAPERLMSPTGEIMSQMYPIFDDRPHSLRRSSGSRGREVRHAPPIFIPPRSSSLSAPTSQSNSRAGSMSSDNRKPQTQRPPNPQHSSTPHIRINISDPDTKPVAKPAEGFIDPFRSDDETRMSPVASPNLRASLTRTPFSIISTPGLVEFGQGTSMSIYPHNNDSVLVVQHSHRPESQESCFEPQVRQVTSQPPADHRQRQRNVTPQNREEPRSQGMRRNISATSTSTSVPIHTPSRTSRSDKIYNLSRTPSGRRQSQSFITPLSKLPLLAKSTPVRQRIRVSDQSNTLSQFWRPDGFWNDLSDSEDEPGSSAAGDVPETVYVARNTLGLSSQPIMTGPVGLAKRLGSFKRRKQLQASQQNSSQGFSTSSLQNGLSTVSSGFERTPAKRRHSFSFIPITNIYDTIQQKRTDRADAQKEKKRQRLKQIIGPAVLRDSARQF